MIAWQQIADLQDCPLWEDEALLAAIASAGELAEEITAEQVAVAIHNAALTYALSQYRAQARPLIAEEEARAVADASRKLLAACSPRWRTKEGRSSISPDALRQSLGPGGLFAVAHQGGNSGQTAVVDALRGVAQLERWADVLAERHASKRRVPSPGAPKNEALPKLLDAMEQIYMTAWGKWPSLKRARVPATIRHECPPEGFLAFLCDVFPIIAARGFEIPSGHMAIEQAARRHRRGLKAAGSSPFWHEPLDALTK
jgi:hypothetical protein